LGSQDGERERREVVEKIDEERDGKDKRREGGR
jgi:hypothetical protein